MAFQKDYRVLPLANDSGSTSKDTGPNSKEIALVEENLTKPNKDNIRKKFERPDGSSLLLHRWNVDHTRKLEELPAEYFDGTGMRVGEALYLNVDGFCSLNAIVPVKGDSIASSAVHGGGGGQLFGALKISFDQPDQVVRTTPLAITELSDRVLQFPYHLDLMNPMTAPEFCEVPWYTSLPYLPGPSLTTFSLVTIPPRSFSFHRFWV